MLIPNNVHFRIRMHGHGDKGMAIYEEEDVQGLGIMIKARRETAHAKWVETFYLKALPGREFSRYTDLVAAAAQVTDENAAAEAAMYPYVRTVAPDRCGNRCRLCPPGPYVPGQGRVHHDTTRVTIATCWREAHDFSLSLCAEHAKQYLGNAADLLAADVQAREARLAKKGGA